MLCHNLRWLQLLSFCPFLCSILIELFFFLVHPLMLGGTVKTPRARISFRNAIYRCDWLHKESISRRGYSWFLPWLCHKSASNHSRGCNYIHQFWDDPQIPYYYISSWTTSTHTLTIRLYPVWIIWKKYSSKSINQFVLHCSWPAMWWRSYIFRVLQDDWITILA